MATNVPDPTKWALVPDDKDSFARWLLTLKRDDLVIDKFNGYMFDKTFKSINDLYNEWWNGQRIIEQKKRIEEINKNYEYGNTNY